MVTIRYGSCECDQYRWDGGWHLLSHESLLVRGDLNSSPFTVCQHMNIFFKKFNAILSIPTHSQLSPTPWTIFRRRYSSSSFTVTRYLLSFCLWLHTQATVDNNSEKISNYKFFKKEWFVDFNANGRQRNKNYSLEYIPWIKYERCKCWCIIN